MLEEQDMIDNIDDKAHELKGRMAEKYDNAKEGFQERLEDLDDKEEK